jgi:hypothetical protein
MTMRMNDHDRDLDKNTKVRWAITSRATSVVDFLAKLGDSRFGYTGIGRETAAR